MTDAASEPNLVPSKRFHGVFFDKERDLWVVQVVLPDDSVADCGSYIDETEAAHRYDYSAQQLLDDPNLQLNFPDDAE